MDTTLLYANAKHTFLPSSAPSFPRGSKSEAIFVPSVCSRWNYLSEEEPLVAMVK